MLSAWNIPDPRMVHMKHRSGEVTLRIVQDGCSFARTPVPSTNTRAYYLDLHHDWYEGS